MSIRNPEVIQADRDQFGALALYVVQRPAKAKSVLELETGKACLWFRHFPSSVQRRASAAAGLLARFDPGYFHPARRYFCEMLNR